VRKDSYWVSELIFKSTVRIRARARVRVRVVLPKNFGFFMNKKFLVRFTGKSVAWL
jgi:hypothetical protein